MHVPDFLQYSVKFLTANYCRKDHYNPDFVC